MQKIHDRHSFVNQLFLSNGPALKCADTPTNASMLIFHFSVELQRLSVIAHCLAVYHYVTSHLL